MYRPKEANEMITPIKLLKRVETIVSGAPEFTYPETVDSPLIYCNFKTFGGTETVVNGLLINLSTASLVTWYRPDITGADHILLLQDRSEWEIIGDPENIEMRNQLLVFKVKKVKRGS